MKEGDVYNYIVEAYEVFSRKVHDLPTFRFKPSENESKQIGNFISLLYSKYDKNSIGRSFLYNFFVFNYEYWSNLDHGSKGRIPLNWIIGEKAVEKWKNRNEDDLYHAIKYVDSFGIYAGLIKAGTEKKSNDIRNISEAEEIEKRRFYNTGAGLVICQESTTLFNDNSILCKGCMFKDLCKEDLKKKFPKIYIARGYLDI